MFFKGEINNAYINDGLSMTGSRKSQHDDAVSQFSVNNRLNRSDFHNFQL